MTDLLNPALTAGLPELRRSAVREALDLAHTVAIALLVTGGLHKLLYQLLDEARADHR